MFNQATGAETKWAFKFHRFAHSAGPGVVEQRGRRGTGPRRRKRAGQSRGSQGRRCRSRLGNRENHLGNQLKSCWKQAQIVLETGPKSQGNKKSFRKQPNSSWKQGNRLGNRENRLGNRFLARDRLGNGSLGTLGSFF